MMSITRFLPAVVWLRNYDRQTLSADALAAVIVTVLLIPQSLAYSMLAGLPPEVGLYASILPLMLYAIFGSSRTLSVGPVAVISLMTATALGGISEELDANYLSAAVSLALLCGVFSLTLGALRMGFVTNFLSHSVVSGFITASAIIIAFSQLKHILGVAAEGDNVFALAETLASQAGKINSISAIIGLSVLGFLLWSRHSLTTLLPKLGLSHYTAGMIAKAAPIFGVAGSVLAVYMLSLEQTSLSLVGDIPQRLPSITLPDVNMELLEHLWLPALMITLIGYVESVSVGKTLATKRRQKIDVNQELIALGAANVASACSGAYPVTGGFSRTVVNFDAGATTQMASILTAFGIAMATLFLTPLLYYLPKATLAATIIVAVLTLVDFSILKKTWNCARQDFTAVLITIIVTLTTGVEIGVLTGVLTSLGLHLYRSSRPHIAEVGLVPGTEHFRNIRHFHVETDSHIISLRIDESLYFANASYLEDKIYETIYERDNIAHVILMLSAVNEIDYSALETLEIINEQLEKQGVQLHLSEVKGPVIKSLEKSRFTEHISGKIFLTQFDAYTHIKNCTAQYKSFS